MPTSEDMSVFLRIVERGSFARVAEELGLSPSAASKLVSRMEDRLGVRLLTRTTRRLALTYEGAIYAERAREALALIEAANSEVSAARQSPRGLLRINSSTGFGRQGLLLAIPAFQKAYPEVEIDLSLTDRIIDPVADAADIVIRGSPAAPEGYVVQQLAEGRRIICAAPSYLARRGTPLTAADLNGHDCIALSNQSQATRWPLAGPTGTIEFLPRGRFACDNVGMLFDMALAGHGIIRLADFVVGRAVQEGSLVELLRDVNRGNSISLWSLMPRGRFRLPRVKAFIDFLESWLRENAPA